MKARVTASQTARTGDEKRGSTWSKNLGRAPSRLKAYICKEAESAHSI